MSSVPERYIADADALIGEAHARLSLDQFSWSLWNKAAKHAKIQKMVRLMMKSNGKQQQQDIDNDENAYDSTMPVINEDKKKSVSKKKKRIRKKRKKHCKSPKHHRQNINLTQNESESIAKNEESQNDKNNKENLIQIGKQADDDDAYTSDEFEKNDDDNNNDMNNNDIEIMDIEDAATELTEMIDQFQSKTDHSVEPSFDTQLHPCNWVSSTIISHEVDRIRSRKEYLTLTLREKHDPFKHQIKFNQTLRNSNINPNSNPNNHRSNKSLQFKQDISDKNQSITININNDAQQLLKRQWKPVNVLSIQHKSKVPHFNQSERDEIKQMKQIWHEKEQQIPFSSRLNARKFDDSQSGMQTHRAITHRGHRLRPLTANSRKNLKTSNKNGSDLKAPKSARTLRKSNSKPIVISTQYDHDMPQLFEQRATLNKSNKHDRFASQTFRDVREHIYDDDAPIFRHCQYKILNQTLSESLLARNLIKLQTKKKRKRKKRASLTMDIIDTQNSYNLTSPRKETKKKKKVKLSKTEKWYKKEMKIAKKKWNTICENVFENDETKILEYARMTSRGEASQTAKKENIERQQMLADHLEKLQQKTTIMLLQTLHKQKSLTITRAVVHPYLNRFRNRKKAM